VAQVGALTCTMNSLSDSESQVDNSETGTRFSKKVVAAVFVGAAVLLAPIAIHMRQSVVSDSVDYLRTEDEQFGVNMFECGRGRGRGCAQEAIRGGNHIIKSGFDDRCLIFSHNGHGKFPERHMWGTNHKEFCGWPDKEQVLGNKQAVWNIRHIEEDKYIIKSAFNDRCLIFGHNGHGKFPERHMWGTNHKELCGWPDKKQLLGNKQAVWKIQHIEDDKYIIRSAFNDRCLIFGHNGHGKFPERHMWGTNHKELCGWPDKQQLLGNKQAVWKIRHIEDDKYIIRSAFNDRCLIFGRNGHGKFPERHMWGTNHKELCGWPDKAQLLNNKQAVWSLQSLAPAPTPH